MSPGQRLRYFGYLIFKSAIGILDLAGVLSIGYLATSIALFVTNGSDPNRIIRFAGLELPAVTASNLPLIASAILATFVLKAITAIILTRNLAYFLANVEAQSAKRVAELGFGEDLTENSKLSREEIFFAVQVGSPSAFNGLLNYLGTIVAEGTLFVLIIISFFSISPAAAAITLCMFSTIALVIQRFTGKRMQKNGNKITEGTIEANQTISDLSDVFREALISNKRHFYIDKIFKARQQTASSAAAQIIFLSLPRYIVETSLIVGIAVLVLVQAAQGNIASAAGTLGVFLSGGLRLTAALLPLQNAALSMKQVLPSAAKALEILGKSGGGISQEISQRAPKEIHPPISVTLKDISYTYAGSETPSLAGVSLEIQAGQQIALIGPSGAGKSTLADLILGLVKPTKGEVYLDGLAPRDYLNSSRGALGYVPQKPGLVSGSIEENIALGSNPGEIDNEALELAILKSNLKKVIEKLPEGIKTSLGKNKDALSGGQMQRIGLARALYSNPSLLVMDEATSSLDAESEKEINKALNQMRGKVTVILIAHRLNTVQHSDVVFLVENGKITASGTFPDLLRNNSTVRNLASLMAIDTNEI